MGALSVSTNDEVKLVNLSNKREEKKREVWFSLEEK